MISMTTNRPTLQCPAYAQRTHDTKITLLCRQQDVATSFWRHSGVIIAPCASLTPLFGGCKPPETHYLVKRKPREIYWIGSVKIEVPDGHSRTCPIVKCHCHCTSSGLTDPWNLRWRELAQRLFSCSVRTIARRECATPNVRVARSLRAPDGQMTPSLHIYRPRLFHRTWKTRIITGNGLVLNRQRTQFTDTYMRHLCPLLLTWFNFNPSMDK